MPPLCRSHLIDREPYVRSAYADGWLWSWETRRQRPIETGPVLLAGPPPARRPTTPRGLAAGVGGLAVLLTCVRSARADRWRSDPRPQGGLAAGVGPCSPPAPPRGAGASAIPASPRSVARARFGLQGGGVVPKLACPEALMCCGRTCGWRLPPAGFSDLGPRGQEPRGSPPFPGPVARARVGLQSSRTCGWRLPPAGFGPGPQGAGPSRVPVSSRSCSASPFRAAG